MFVYKRTEFTHIPYIVSGTNVNDVKLVVLQHHMNSHNHT